MKKKKLDKKLTLENFELSDDSKKSHQAFSKKDKLKEEFGVSVKETYLSADVKLRDEDYTQHIDVVKAKNKLDTPKVYDVMIEEPLNNEFNEFKPQRPKQYKGKTLKDKIEEDTTALEEAGVYANLEDPKKIVVDNDGVFRKATTDEV